MQGEQGKFTPQDAIRNGEGRIRFAPPTTIKELVGYTARENNPLATSPIHISVREDTLSQTSVYTATIDYRLDGARLAKFLYDLAPNKDGGLDRQGVIDDFYMPNDPSQRDRLERHKKALGKDWDTFEESHRIILDVLNNDPHWPVKRSTNDFFVFLHLRDKKLAEGLLGNASDDFLSELGTFLKNVPYSFKRRKWVQGDEDRETGRRFLSNITDYSYYSGSDVFRRFVMTGFAGNNQSVKEDIARVYASLETEGITLEVSKEGTARVTKNNLFTGEVSFKRDNRGASWWYFDPNTISSANFILPTIRWRKNEQEERQWVLEFLESPLVKHYQQLVDGTSGEVEFDEKRFNPLIGLATIPNLFPGLREGWPKRQAFVHTEEGGYHTVPVESGGNRMGGQAALVVALQNKEVILANEIFDRAEEYADRLAA